MTQSKAGKIWRIVFFCVIFVCFYLYRRYQYERLGVLEFRLGDVRLELPCAVGDIEACGYQVNELTGECDVNEWGIGTVHIVQDDNGRVCEIYADGDKFGCHLEIYGGIDAGYIKRVAAAKGWSAKAVEDIEKIYGKPAEEDGDTRLYVKYKSETEYAYVIIKVEEWGGYKLSRIGIVAR